MNKNNNNKIKKRELLFTIYPREFRLETFRSGGKGGQHQNTTNSGVRIVHIESGAVGESREERSQLQNRKNAFKRLIETSEFKKWHRLKVAELTGRLARIKEEVELEMNIKNLKIEVFRNGKWETIKYEELNDQEKQFFKENV